MKQFISMLLAFTMVFSMASMVCAADSADYYVYVVGEEEAQNEPVAEEPAEVVEVVEPEPIIEAEPAAIASDEELDSGSEGDVTYDNAIDWDRLNKMLDAYSVSKEELTLMIDSAAERVVVASTQRNIMTTPLTNYTVMEGLLAFVCVLLVFVCVIVPFTGRRF